MPFTQVNGINLHYEIRGTGPRVLFIHGIGADLKDPISIFATPVPQYFRILAFDPRGLGESDSPQEPCSIAELADDAAGLAEAAGWERYHLLGASMGGMVAQELALRYPAKVERLVLSVTNGGGVNSGPQVIDKLNEMSTAEKFELSDSRKDEVWVAAHPDMVSQAEQQAKAALAALQANPAHLRGYNNQVYAVLRHDTFARLPQIKAPTLVIGGRYDNSCPPDITRALAEQIPGARYELLESGHGDWYFDSAAWAMIIDFLRG